MRAKQRAQQQPFFVSEPRLSVAMTSPCPPARGCGVFFGNLRAARGDDSSHQTSDTWESACACTLRAEHAPMATKSSFTLVAVLALVSMKKMPLSLAYDSASCARTMAYITPAVRATQRRRSTHRRKLPCRITTRHRAHSGPPRAFDEARTSGSTLRFEFRSDLLPESAMTMLGLPCRCSSFTHCLARWKVS